MRIIAPLLALALLAGCESGAPGLETPESEISIEETPEVKAGDEIEIGESESSGVPLNDSPVALDRDPLKTSENETEAESAELVQSDENPQTVTGPSGISAENSFEAVDEIRNIKEDADLIAQNRARYKVLDVEKLPERSGESEPNIVAYALATSHPVGTKVFARSGLNLDTRNFRNCAKYSFPDLAQIDFLSKGGPERDSLALDPDGDGYACDWDPTPFRKAVN